MDDLVWIDKPVYVLVRDPLPDNPIDLIKSIPHNEFRDQHGKRFRTVQIFTTVELAEQAIDEQDVLSLQPSVFSNTKTLAEALALLTMLGVTHVHFDPGAASGRPVQLERVLEGIRDSLSPGGS